MQTTDLDVSGLQFRVRPSRKRLPLGPPLAPIRHPQAFLPGERMGRELDPIPPHPFHLFLGCVSKPERSNVVPNGPLASCSSASCSVNGDCGSASS